MKLINYEEQLSSRELHLQKKEKEIQSLKDEKIYLENFRLVLDHKLLTLNKEREPLKEQLIELESNIENMYKELCNGSNDLNKLLTEKAGYEYKFENLKNQMKNQSHEIFLLKRKIQLLKYDFGSILKEPIDFWAKEIPKLYLKHFEGNMNTLEPKIRSFSEGQGNSFKDEDVKDELIRHNKYLEHEIKLNTKKNRHIDLQKADHIKQLQIENTELIKDNNKLKINHDKLKYRLMAMENRFGKITLINIRDEDSSQPSTIKSCKTSKNYLKNNFKTKSILEYNDPRELKSLSQEKNNTIIPLINNLEKNKALMESQNNKISNIQVRLFII